MRIKKLYSELIDNWQKYHDIYPDIKRKLILPDWYHCYRTFYEEVDSVRRRLNSGDKLDARRDEFFLRKLIYKQHNGVADVGPSIIRKGGFEYFIKDIGFMTTLTELIKESRVDNFEKFGEAWEKCNYNHHRTRINRIAAACTNKVSSTSSPSHFKIVFKTLIEERLIEFYIGENSNLKQSDEREWFEKNLYLMSELQKIFPASDPLLLSIFVWEIYLHRNNLPA